MIMSGTGSIKYDLPLVKHMVRANISQDPPASMMAGNTDYAEAPSTGYASQVTGGTGTTALAQGDSVQRGSHLSGAMNKLDPAYVKSKFLYDCRTCNAD